MKKFFLPLLLTALTFISISLHAQETPVTWTFKTVSLNDSTAELQFKATIKPNWHLYSQKHNNGIENPIEFSFTPGKEYKRQGGVAEPKPIEHFDPLFGDTSKYFVNSVTFKQKIKILSNEDFVVKGKLRGQSCIDGRCVAIDQKFSFDVKGNPNLTQPVVEETTAEENPADTAAIAPAADTPQNADQPQEEKSLLNFFLVAILGGLAGLLMPCVFPMIPMTVSFFMKSGAKGKFNAIFYGISIVIIYVVIGIGLAAIFGADFANILSTHWIPNILFAIIFIIFAISMFGYFEIALPSSWINKSAKMENSKGLLGIFFMALTLVLVSFSCTLPIAGAVALNSADGSFIKPIIGMLGFSLGIAVPFTIFALFPNMLKSLPKSGSWMNTLKVSLAFIELAFALKFLNVPDQTYHWGILDREVYLAFWIVIFTLMGLYLLGKIRFPLDNEMPVQKSWFRFILAIFVFTFVVYMIPGMFGAPLKAISGWLPPVETQDFDVNKIVREESGSGPATATFSMDETPKYGDRLHLPHGIKGYFDYDQALAVAKKAGKPLFIDFTGHGCTNCRNVESAVWEDRRVRNKFAEEFVVVALYVDDKNIQLAPEDQIKDQDGDPIVDLGGKNMFIQNTIYKENSQPCYFIVGPEGEVLNGPIYYELNVEKYLEFLDAGAKAYQEKYGK
ncbi:MAG: thioredoxin family protein [Bacteroidales bacterium]|nr:thioredoxin family protein [Bacteroidales bacterium]